MKVELELNDRAFNAINNGTKKVEIRVKTPNSTVIYKLLKYDDYIKFVNTNNDKIVCRVLKVNWYKTIRRLLEVEGTLYTLSSTNDIEEGIRSINSFKDYEKSIKANGVYAIHIRKI